MPLLNMRSFYYANDCGTMKLSLRRTLVLKIILFNRSTSASYEIPSIGEQRICCLFKKAVAMFPRNSINGIRSFENYITVTSCSLENGISNLDIIFKTK